MEKIKKYKKRRQISCKKMIGTKMKTIENGYKKGIEFKNGLR